MKTQGFRRTERVSVLLRQHLSEIIARDIKDPRISGVITIVHVGVSKDMRYAKVYTSVMGSPEGSRQAVNALTRAAGFLRNQLKDKLSMRAIPFLSFLHDNSIEQGNNMLSKIDEVSQESLPPET